MSLLSWSGESPTLCSSHHSDHSTPSPLWSLPRRKLQVLEVKPLDRQTCGALLESFLKKTVDTETSQLVSSLAHSASESFFLTDCDTGTLPHPHFFLSLSSNQKTIGDENQSHGQQSLSIPLTGLLLFESQLQTLTNHRLATNPLFLRLLLRLPSLSLLLLSSL
jgi:hypothetical protein